MKKTKKKRRIAHKVMGKLALTIFIINVIMGFTVWNKVGDSLSTAEARYMGEVLACVSGDVKGNISIYTDAVQGLSNNHILRTFLENVRDDKVTLATLSQQEDYQQVMDELNILALLFGREKILDIGLGSLYLDNFLTNKGATGSESFSLASRPYYQAVNLGGLYFSEPYEDHLNNVTVATIANPVFDRKGEAIGILMIDMIIDELGKSLETTQFGDTGMTYLLDRNNTIIYHADSSLVGTNVLSSLSICPEFQEAVVNSDGQIHHFLLDDVKRTGGVSTIDSMTGWKIVSVMDTSEFQAGITMVSRILIVTNVVIILLTSLFCVKGISTHLRPLEQLEEYARGVSQGDLSAPLDFYSNDEVGSLALELEECITALTSTIVHINQIMGEFGQGNFQLDDDFDYMGDFQTIRQSMERFVDLMSGSLTDLANNIHEVGGGAVLLSHRAQELAVGSTQQNDSVIELRDLIHGINDRISQTADHSSTITQDAQSISDKLVLSHEKMRELVVSVQDIEVMSNQVKSIIKAIEDVAFQTNILALNAAVEAARSDVSGKGFAVVATEVRKLSQRTAEAVEDTTQIINDIAKAIGTGTNLAETTSGDLQGLVKDVEEFVENISHISLSTQDQAQAILMIDHGIAEIATVVRQNSIISEESAAASEELSSQTTLMMDSVKQFQLK